MKKIFWTLVFWIIVLGLFGIYIRFFNANLGVSLTHLLVQPQTPIATDTGSLELSPIMEKITALDIEIGIATQKIQERKAQQEAAMQIPTGTLTQSLPILSPTATLPPTISTPQNTVIQLFYFNSKEDEKLAPNQQINLHSILPVHRSILVSTTPIKDTIDALLQGALSTDEIGQGFTTEFPNKDFHLLNRQLDSSGVLTLEFSEVSGFTDGGSARMLLMANSIIKTAMQFPEVKKVLLMPETLFQP